MDLRRLRSFLTVAAVAPRRAGVLRVVATAFSKFLLQFARLYPNVEVKLIESSGVVLAMVERADVHVGLTATDPAAINGPRIGIYPVMPLGLLAASRPSFPLKAQRSTQAG